MMRRRAFGFRTDNFNAHKNKILFACVAAYTMSYLCRTNLSLALDDLIASLQITRSAAGLWGTAYFWVYAAGQLFCGWLCTRHRPKNIVTVGLILSAACNLCVSIAATYTQIFLLWMLNGFALSLFWAPLVQIMARWITSAEYVRVSIWLNLPTTVGYLLSWGLLGTLKTISGWRAVFSVPAVIALLFTVYWVFFVRATPEAAGFSAPAESAASVGGTSKKSGLLRTLCSVTMLSFGLIILVHGSTKESINLWAPTLISDVASGQSAALVSGFTALVPVFSTAGLLLTGWGLRKIQGGQNRMLLLLILGGCGCGWALVLFHESLFAVLLFMGLLLGILYGSSTILTTLIPLRFARSGNAAVVTGIFNFLAYVGAALGGFLSGWVSDAYGWNSVYLVWAAMNTIALVIFFLAEIWHHRH